MIRLASRAGYRMVLWSILTDDVEGMSAPVMERRILEGAEDGGIVLMHSGVGGTVDVLPVVIKKLRQRGYHFVTVSTLLGLPSTSASMPQDTPILRTASAPTPSQVLHAQ